MAQQTLNLPRESTQERMADALEDIVDKIVDTSSASNIDYDNTQSGLDADKVQGAVDELAEEKVDKETGKGLSTNDYTDTEKQKLSGIEAGAQVNTVTSVAGKMGEVSLVKSDVGLDNVDNTADLNKPISRYTQAALDEKTDVNSFNALTQEIELFNTYDLTNDVEISVFANDTYKRDKYDRVYESHVPNLDGEYSVSLGDKTFTETCTFTIANQGTSITEVFHTNRKYILGAKLLKAENGEVGEDHVIADVVTLLISKDAPYTTTFDPYLEHPPVTGVLTLKVSVKPDEKYVNGIDELAYWGSYNGSDLLINNPILTYSETTFGQPKVSGNPITINDAAEANAVYVSVDIEPIQDLHGYDHPWVGGAGKNKLPLTVDGIKGANPSATWNGNNTTINGVTFSIQTDSNGNVIGLNANGTASGDSPSLYLARNVALVDGSYVLNGCPNNGSLQSYGIFADYSSGGNIPDYGSGATLNISNVTLNLRIRIANSYTASNLTFKPMIRLATETDPTFAPYSNICPISGWDEVNVGVSGKNLFDKSTAILNKTLKSADGTEKNNNGYFCSDYIKIFPITTYYLTKVFGQAFSHAGCLYDKNKNFIRSFTITGTTAQSSSSYTITDTNAYYMRINGDMTAIDTVQVEKGSTATSSYEPYKGKTYTIQLGDTIYGGELDVITGELRVDRGYISDLSSLSWELQGTGSDGGTVFYAIVGNKKNSATKGICSSLQTMFYDGWSSTKKGTINLGHSTKSIFASIEGITTVEDFKTAVTGQTLVYELATPYTIQLTPQQIKLLKGTNHLSCNTGDLSIKYYPDNVLGQLKGDIESEYDAIIQNLLERIEALENQQ